MKMNEKERELSYINVYYKNIREKENKENIV